MFKFLTDSIENALDVATGLFDGATGGELPSKEQVARLIADGLTVYAASEALGVSVEVIEAMLDD